jgi:hypothetical protein
MGCKWTSFGCTCCCLFNIRGSNWTQVSDWSNSSHAQAHTRHPDDGQAILTGLAHGFGARHNVTRRGSTHVRTHYGTAPHGGGLSGGSRLRLDTKNFRFQCPYFRMHNIHIHREQGMGLPSWQQIF